MATAEENLLAGTLGGSGFSWRRDVREGNDDNEKVAEALKAGANPEVTVAGLTPLMIAAKKGSDIFKILLDYGANPNTVICDEGGGVLGMGAVGERVMRSLGMSDSEQRSIIQGSLMRLGRSALHIACEFGHDECVKELLEKDANPNLKDKNGYTPLMCGLESRAIIDDMSMKRRLEEEPDPELRDLYAAWPSIMDMLISSRADLKARNNDGDSALDIAEKMSAHATSATQRKKEIIMEIIKILESPYRLQAAEDRLVLAESSLPGPPSKIEELDQDTLIKLAGFITPDMIRQAEMARLKAEAESKRADNPARPLRQGWRRRTSRRTGETYYVSPSGTSTFDHPGYQPEPDPEPEPEPEPEQEPEPPASAGLGKKRRRKKSISSKKRRMKMKGRSKRRKSKRRKSKKKKSSRRRIRKK